MLYLIKRNILCPSQGFGGGGGGGGANRGIRSFISGEQRNQSLKLMRTGDQRQFGGTRNITNQDFDFLGTRENVDFFFRETREQVPPHTSPAPPPPAPTERASIILPGKDQESSWHCTADPLRGLNRCNLPEKPVK